MSATTARAVRTRQVHDEAQLFARAQSGDSRAKEILVERYLPLARSLARRYSRSSTPMEDLNQVASLGLLKGIDRFDPGVGKAFASYAVPTILGELRRYFRDFGWSTHVPRGAQERALAVRSIRDRLINETGTDPTVNQLAEYAEMSLEDVLDALIALNAYESRSLDAPADDEAEETQHDRFGVSEPGYELAEDKAVVSSELRELPTRDRAILQMRFGQELTQREIAAELGVSQMQISRQLKRTLDGLHSALSAA